MVNMDPHLNLQAGIGTYTIPELVKPWMSGLSKTLDMMLGTHLDAHIMGKPTMKLCTRTKTLILVHWNRRI